MMAGKPIICAVSTTQKTLIEEFACGIQVSSANPSVIKDAILRIYETPESERKVMGNNGKKAVLDFFTYKSLANKFIKNI